MIKNSIELSSEVSDKEIYQAKKSLLSFKYTVKSLFLASDYLNLMKTPFKDNSEVSPDEIWDSRVSLRNFRNKAIDNFNEFKIKAFKSINLIYSFSSDTQIIQLIKSFISSVDGLEKLVNEFVDLFDDLKSKEFTKKIIELIEKIQDKCKDIKELISERLKDYIQDNILASNWLDEVGMKNKLKIEHKDPLLVELHKEK